MRFEIVSATHSKLRSIVALSCLTAVLGSAPPPDPEKNADEEVPADEKVVVDLWHWRDDYIQPIQRIRAERNETNLSGQFTYSKTRNSFNSPTKHLKV
jgi:hypothetical protein